MPGIGSPNIFFSINDVLSTFYFLPFFQDQIWATDLIPLLCTLYTLGISKSMNAACVVLVVLVSMLVGVKGFGIRGLTVARGARGRGFRSSALSMKLQTGIVGLPNVGKSTLFNALVGSETAQAANFPFCTIEPNVGIVNVPDNRLERLAVVHSSVKTVAATMEFVDIAGIVKGASTGEGLGNKFLTNIRMTDAIVHVVRCFEDPDVIHVDGSVDPLRDVDVINLELVLADLEQIERRFEKAKKDRKTEPEEIVALEKIKETLESGNPASEAGLDEEQLAFVKSLMLLTLKPVIYAANVADSDLAEGNEMSKKVFEMAAAQVRAYIAYDD